MKNIKGYKIRIGKMQLIKVAKLDFIFAIIRKLSKLNEGKNSHMNSTTQCCETMYSYTA